MAKKLYTHTISKPLVETASTGAADTKKSAAFSHTGPPASKRIAASRAAQALADNSGKDSRGEEIQEAFRSLMAGHPATAGKYRATIQEAE